MSPRLTLSFAFLLASASVAKADTLIFLPPIGETKAATELGYLMHARAEHALVEDGDGAVVGLRQILTAAEDLQLKPEAWSGPTAERLAHFVGTDRFVVARLLGKARPYTLELRVVTRGKAGQKTLTKLPSSSSGAVNAGGRAIASTALGRAVVPRDELPTDMHDDAVAAYASCSSGLLQQAIALDSPAPLRADELERAMKSCRETIALYPQFDDARAKLGLALALSNRAQEAVDLLRTVPTQHYEPSLWLAHYWLATRQSPEAGLALLKKVVERFPSSLYAKAMLNDHLFAMRRYEDALVVANGIRALVPENPITNARVSVILSRLGRNQEAIRMAEEAVKKDPQDFRNLATLAGRYLDANRYQDALDDLKRIEPAPARVLNLRGWAYLRLGKLDDAQHAFEDAYKTTNGAQLEWRTRGRVWAGLLRVAAARGDDKAMRTTTAQIVDEGFVAFLRALQDPAVTAALDKAHAPAGDVAASAKPGVSGPRYIRPSEATPFNLDPAGEIDPHSRALTSPPNQLELMRF